MKVSAPQQDPPQRTCNRFFITNICLLQKIDSLEQSFHLAMGYAPGESAPTIGGESTLCIPLSRLVELEEKIAKEVTGEDVTGKATYGEGFGQGVSDARLWIRAEIARVKAGN